MKLALILATTLVAVFLLDRLLLAMESRGWIYYRKSKGDSRPGDAFLAVHQLIEPEKKNLLEVRQDEHEEQDESGDPPDPEEPTRQSNPRTPE